MSDIVVRPLRTHGELAACVALQHETWGAGFSDAVPPSVLKVAQEVGGVAAGAFDRADTLLGFVFGITGVRDGVLVHWSDMLAVRADARNTGIGRRLKAHQREAMRAIGVRTILWTYDPLVLRNAHINFQSLGVEVVRYARDMYGSTDSVLHGGMPTDRLIVAWPTDPHESAALTARAGAALARDWKDVPVIGRPGSEDGHVFDAAARLRVAIPRDLEGMVRTNVGVAREWRMSVRTALEGALAAGLHIAGVDRGAEPDVGHYLLERSR